MSGADKARFHLEQTVPELREWERRAVFTRPEITAIARKRSEFEHTLAARGASTPAAYARYVAYELNVAALARKRITRLGLARNSAMLQHSGQKRLFGILERGTRKHHGSLELWMQYLEYCRHEGARKRLQRVMTECARMFPTRAEVWLWAAAYEMDVQGDVGAARGWMQRGLRFCPRDKTLWVEYARLEMGFVAKVAGRRRILGLDEGAEDRTNESIRNDSDKNEDDSADVDADEIALPTITAEEMDAEMEDEDRPRRSRGSGLDEAVLAKLAKSPALTGAIPKTILDTALQQFTPQASNTISSSAWNNLDALAASFFEMFAEYVGIVDCASGLMQQVLDTVPASSSNDNAGHGVLVSSCRCRQPVVGVEVDSVAFPGAVRESLKRIRQARAALSEAPKEQERLASALLSWLQPMLDNDKLAPELTLVLKATVKSLQQ